jgi:hypothetical protein
MKGMPLLQPPGSAHRAASFAELGKTVVQWVRRGCSGPVVRRVSLPGVACSVATGFGVETAKDLVALARGQLAGREIAGRLVRNLVVATTGAAAAAGLAAAIAGLPPPAQLVVLVLGALLIEALERLVSDRFDRGSPRSPALRLA